MSNKKTVKGPAGMRYGESAFDILYLLFDLVAGLIFLWNGQRESIFYLWGALALVLGAGDAFHLIPRVQMHLFGSDEKTQKKLGIGMAVTSVTMTAYYLILFQIYVRTFPNIHISSILTALLYGCALFRIVVCLLPQNKWTTGGNFSMSLLRNLPFLVVGVIMIYLFAVLDHTADYGLWKMSIAITLSFSFYLPVTFGAKRKPMLGALMLPKTLMYMWMISMGLNMIGNL